MKGVIGDSILAHLTMFVFLVFMLSPIIKLYPVFFVATGVWHVLLIFHSAITIADFEMSEQGRILNKLESHDYKRVDIHWYK